MVNANSNGFTLFFAVVACVVSGVLLSLASLGLKETQQLNIKVDKQKSVLQAAGLYQTGDSKDKITGWFEGDNPTVKAFLIETESGELHDAIAVEDYLKKPKNYSGISVIYECNKAGEESYILPIVGKGLWGKMYGYLALAKDGNNILGIRFYDHKETPGLGAKITEASFENQFKTGKKLLIEKDGDWIERFQGIQVLKGSKVESKPEAEQAYLIDGISGATITSVGVQGILEDYIRNTYGEFLKKRKS